MRVAVILVNWNAVDVTLDCIESIQRARHPEVSIIVVDNGSSDDSAEKIKKRYSSVVLIQNHENRGFCAANNQAISYALRNGFEVIVILNNDTIVERNFFHNSLSRMSEANADVLAPAIYFAEHPTRYWFVLGRANLWSGLFSNPFHKKEEGMVGPMDSTEFAVGCCFLAKSEVFRNIGGFDENLFMYFEDIDWSLRVRQAGFEILLEPKAKVYHWVSFSGNKAAKLRRFYMTRNHLWILRRYSKWYHRLVWQPLVPIRSLYRTAKLIRHLDFACIPFEFKGVAHGLFRKLPPQTSHETR